MHPSPEPGDPTDAALIWAGEARRADDAEVVERIEVEAAVTSWSSLVNAGNGRPVEAVTDDGVHHRGQIAASGDRWVLIESDIDNRLLMLDRVVSVVGLGSAASPARVILGPGSVLRRWWQTREAVTVQLADGSRMRGQVAAVLADAIQLWTDSEPPQRLLLPLRGVTWVSAERDLP